MKKLMALFLIFLLFVQTHQQQITIKKLGARREVKINKKTNEHIKVNKEVKNEGKKDNESNDTLKNLLDAFNKENDFEIGESSLSVIKTLLSNKNSKIILINDEDNSFDDHKNNVNQVNSEDYNHKFNDKNLFKNNKILQTSFPKNIKMPIHKSNNSDDIANFLFPNVKRQDDVINEFSTTIDSENHEFPSFLNLSHYQTENLPASIMASILSNLNKESNDKEENIYFYYHLSKLYFDKHNSNILEFFKTTFDNLKSLQKYFKSSFEKKLNTNSLFNYYTEYFKVQIKVAKSTLEKIVEELAALEKEIFTFNQVKNNSALTTVFRYLRSLEINEKTLDFNEDFYLLKTMVVNMDKISNFIDEYKDVPHLMYLFNSFDGKFSTIFTKEDLERKCMCYRKFNFGDSNQEKDLEEISEGFETALASKMSEYQKEGIEGPFIKLIGRKRILKVNEKLVNDIVLTLGDILYSFKQSLIAKLNKNKLY